MPNSSLSTEARLAKLDRETLRLAKLAGLADGSAAKALPSIATKAAKLAGLVRADVYPRVAALVYRETGAANPFPASVLAAGERGIGAEIRRRRAQGTRLDVLVASYRASGLPGGRREVEALAAKAGADATADYLGRGTRARAYATRTDPALAVAEARKGARTKAGLAPATKTAPATDAPQGTPASPEADAPASGADAPASATRAKRAKRRAAKTASA